MFYLNQEKAMNKKHYSKFNLFIRSLVFSLYSLISIMIYSLFVICCWPITSLRFRHRLIRAFLYAYLNVLRVVCLVDYRIEGLDNIPKDRNGIVLCKHQSTWETFLLPLFFHDPAPIAKKELLWVPFFGWGFAASDPITINRRSKSTAMQQVIAKGKKCLDAGRWIMVFPEGTRIPPGKIGKYKLGGARLASATGYPVVPVAHNAGRFWPRRKFIKQPGTISVVIGPLIESEGRAPEEILDLAKNWIEGTMVRIDRSIDESTRQ